MRDEYLDTIKNRTEAEVIDLIRNFLISCGSLGTDEGSFAFLMYNLEKDKATFERLMETEYYKRLLRGFLTGSPIWEGNTWIIDLLPHEPKVALEGLHAYFIAHIQHLPDGRFDGLGEVEALIRAKFIQAPSSEALLTLDPYQFEHLIDSLYMKMGYSTVLTKRTYDGGVDVIATKSTPGSIEKILIQCKHVKKDIGVKEVRALLGVVFDNKANKGIIISSVSFTPAARKLQQNNPIDLIGNKELQLLLNANFGSNWPLHLDFILSRREAMERLKKQTMNKNKKSELNTGT